MNNKKIAVLLSFILSLTLVSGVYSQGVQKKNDTSSESKVLKIQEKASTTASSTFRERERVMINASSSTSTKNNLKATSTNNKGGLAEEHRSEVSKFVQVLLNAADRSGGIGQQVRIIAREQASTSSTTTATIKKLEERSGLKTFLIGADYKNLGKLRGEIVQTRNNIEKLKGELLKISTSTEKTALEDELKNMEQLQDKIQTFVSENENRFSLFGWFIKLIQ